MRSFFHHQFHFSGWNVGVDGIGVAALDRADGRNHELVAQRFRLLVHGGVPFVVEDYLGYAGAVAEVEMKIIWPRSRRRLTHPMSTPMVPRIGAPRDLFLFRLRVTTLMVVGILVLFGFYLAKLPG